MILATCLHTRHGGDEWEIRPERALVRRRDATVLVTDLHLGKSDHFRAAGIPVPDATDRDTLGRLDALCRAVDARRLVVLGDLFHNRRGVTPGLVAKLAAFRAAWPDLEVLNVRGNHDRHAGDPPAGLGIECLDGPVVDAGGGVAYAHEPAQGLAEPGADGCAGGGWPSFCGHLHPAVVMRTGRDRMRMPCFLFRGGTALLPAFGAFTGSSPIRPRPGDRVYAVGPGRVADVSAAVTPRAAQLLR